MRSAAAVDAAFTLAAARHRGPVFLDASLEALFGRRPARRPAAGTGAAEPARPAAQAPRGGRRPRPARPPRHRAQVARLLAAARRPVLVLGSDVWLDGAEEAARTAAEHFQLPVIANGQGRGILPAGHPLLVTRARAVALGEADLVIVAGTPLDFRLGYGQFGGKNGTPPARSSTSPTRPTRSPRTASSPRSAAGEPQRDLRRPRRCSEAAPAGGRLPGRCWPWVQDWLPRLQQVAAQAVEADAALLHSDASPIQPLRIYGELAGLLEPDAVVIGDGGDFVSYAGKYVEPQQPGGWLDPGPYGCLGTGLGYAIAARVARPPARWCCCSATARPASR